MIVITYPANPPKTKLAFLGIALTGTLFLFAEHADIILSFVCDSIFQPRF